MPRAIKTNNTYLKPESRYVCADNLRFASALTIVTVHSTTVLTMASTKSPAAELLKFAAVTIVKFGTIGFFLISGFLFERSLRNRTSFEVLKKRFTHVFLPWVFWFSFTCLALFGPQFLQHKGFFVRGVPLSVSIEQSLLDASTTTAFWFVPNLMVASTVLILFRRYLRSLWFGAVLLAVTLFYSVNIYTGWIDTHHARALFGFVFYLWLGHYAAVNFDRFSRFLDSVSTRLLWLGTVLAAGATFGEGRLLFHLHSADPLNTLKVTTQVFSVMVFLCFFKYPRRLWPTFIDVSRTTFGMYLTHVITFVAFTWPLRAVISRPGSHPILDSLAGRVLLWLATVALVASASFMLSRALSASPILSWTVGSPRRPSRAQQKKQEVSEIVVAT